MQSRITYRIAFAALLLLAAAPTSADTLLSADFEGMTVDQPVGTGGPTLGEPVHNSNCVSTIRDAPFASNCLELDDETVLGREACDSNSSARRK